MIKPTNGVPKYAALTWANNWVETRVESEGKVWKMVFFVFVLIWGRVSNRNAKYTTDGIWLSKMLKCEQQLGGVGSNEMSYWVAYIIWYDV
mgnify:CR=1 FL=1